MYWGFSSGRAWQQLSNVPGSFMRDFIQKLTVKEKGKKGSYHRDDVRESCREGMSGNSVPP